VFVPDRDVFPALHRSWLPVGRVVCGVQPPEVVASLAEKALAKQLRTDPAGTERLGQAAAALAHIGGAAASGYVLTANELLGSVLLRTLSATAQTMSSEDHDGAGLVARTLTRVVRDQLSTLRPRLVNVEAFENAGKAAAYLEQCAAGVRVGPFVEQVTSGSHHRVRAPQRRRRSTADLLYEALA
jgi:hypothetical protein